MTDVKTLMEMGFPKERAEYALNVTNNKGVEAAMEWLLAHADEQIPAGTAAAAPEAATLKLDTSVTNEDAAASISVTAAANAATNSGPPKSLKCDNCGRLFKDGVDAQYHALKAGHHDFSESTEEKPPLTEEEKKEQLAILEQRLKEKRIEREQREKADALERERNRIRSGKDMTEAKKRMEEMEMKKILEQRKREKADEKAARERVRAQIEADKAMRKAREQGASYLEAQNIVSSTTPQKNGGGAGSPAGTPTAAAGGSTTPTGVKSPPKEYSETRIQIRLQDGSTLQETFNVKEQLSAVRVFIQMKTGSDAPFALMTTFPRKIFNDDDYEKPLELLGLVPSAVVIMTKSVV